MQQLARIFRHVKPEIGVDFWDTEAYPINESDRIFSNVRGEIILPFCQMFNRGEDFRQLDYFIMNTKKRSYNSDEIRDHICRYLNYFEKYYDTNKELIMVMYEMKNLIDYTPTYSAEMLINDINRYIIRNNRIYSSIRQFVEDNYIMKLSGNNNKTPNLQFEDRHAKVLYEISLMMNMYIPLATHFMYTRYIKQKEDIQDFILGLFDLTVTKYEEEQGIYIYDKLYETATSVVNKSKNPDKLLWDKNAIRGINTTTHTTDSVIDIVLQILPKYSYYDIDKNEESNIINFNYYSNRKCLYYKITGIEYEYSFVKLSSSKRDEDNNSEMDKYDARTSKKDEALLLQNKVAYEDTVRRIELIYGPFSNEEIDFYRRKLIKDNKPVMNSFQKQLIGYMFFKDLGDPVTFKSTNQIDYIKLMIAAKRILLKSGMVILPYIISSKVIRISARKNMNKKEELKVQSDELFHKLEEKYNNPRVIQQVYEMLGKITSSEFEIIDYDDERKCPTDKDGLTVPMIVDLISQEVVFFINTI